MGCDCINSFSLLFYLLNYFPFVRRTPSSNRKKYLRRAKIRVNTAETRKRYDTGIYASHTIDNSTVLLSSI